jgi:hypothetical protein
MGPRCRRLYISRAGHSANSIDHKIPLMGVMGAFVFAAQMINFPVGNGTSGHLVGGALLSFTLGPAPASIVMTAILMTQALVFQDGGHAGPGRERLQHGDRRRPGGLLTLCAVSRTERRHIPRRSAFSHGQRLFCARRINSVGCSDAGDGAGDLAGVIRRFGSLRGRAITLAVTRSYGANPAGFHAPTRGHSWHARAIALATGVRAALVVAGVFVTSAWPDGIQKLVSQSGYLDPRKVRG